MDSFDEREKHFTVHNYASPEKLLNINCEDFIPCWDQQYPNFPWNSVEVCYRKHYLEYSRGEFGLPEIVWQATSTFTRIFNIYAVACYIYTSSQSSNRSFDCVTATHNACSSSELTFAAISHCVVMCGLPYVVILIRSLSHISGPPQSLSSMFTLSQWLPCSAVPW